MFDAEQAERLNVCSGCGRPLGPDKLPNPKAWCLDCQALYNSISPKNRRQTQAERLEKDRIQNQKRKEKYRSDPEFRERVMAARRKWINKTDQD